MWESCVQRQNRLPVGRAYAECVDNNNNNTTTNNNNVMLTLRRQQATVYKTYANRHADEKCCHSPRWNASIYNAVKCAFIYCQTGNKKLALYVVCLDDNWTQNYRSMRLYFASNGNSHPSTRPPHPSTRPPGLKSSPPGISARVVA